MALRTEGSARANTNNANALASSIVLSCRTHSPTSETIEREDFSRALRRELPDALAKIRAAGVGPVDMAQAAIGPGMAIFTRYRAVLEDSGKPMRVRTALALINHIRDEIDQDDDAVYDLETRFSLDWFAEAGWEARDSGRAILMANGRNISLDGLVRAGLILAHGGKTRLLRRDELPSEPPHQFTTWQAAQYLARAFSAEDGGIDKAAAMLTRVTDRETVRALAYRLFGICSDRSWAAEALVWNRLAEEWRGIEDRAAMMPRDAKGVPDLFEVAR